MPMVDVSPAENIDVVFDADLVGANKEDLVQQSVNVSKSVGKDGEISGSIQEPFQSHFLESSYDKGGKNKNKSKGYRKKSRRNPSISPLGQDRPKKMPRGIDDLFDLDRFIFGDTEGPVNRDVALDNNGAQMSFITPDLNTEGLDNEIGIQ
ncbi:hypothetical protein Hanom_Chr06g00550831 [Helianthus anomalus]